MSVREPKRLDDMPDTGRVLIAHPDREQQAIKAAREQLCDYFLSNIVPTGEAYVLNCDQTFAPPLSRLWWTAAGDLVERWRIRGT
jgi:hypothetical protein